MSKARGLLVFVAGAALGLLTAALPFVRYDYSRVGSDLQRVDRLTGRTEWAGAQGWWSPAEGERRIEARVREFPHEAARLVERAKAREIRRVNVSGRYVAVYPVQGERYDLYADSLEDPRLADLLRDLGQTSVEINPSAGMLPDVVSIR